eukprot:TRINITY_DN12000_c0_g1_i5.p3 TRINITY_DN12000_c0_g1~~TRINITY_DN12000_c0_g1_i5.p3  ORF type:complete len:233 (+),score=57.49 TRINITY_DN12000_c0_g1_i5:93-701(+)
MGGRRRAGSSELSSMSQTAPPKRKKARSERQRSDSASSRQRDLARQYNFPPYVRDPNRWACTLCLKMVNRQARPLSGDPRTKRQILDFVGKYCSPLSVDVKPRGVAGIHPRATPTQLHKALTAKLGVWHPDKIPPAQREAAAEMYRLYTRARRMFESSQEAQQVDDSLLLRLSSAAISRTALGDSTGASQAAVRQPVPPGDA